MKLASHSILSDAAATKDHRFQVFTFLSEEEKRDQRIDGLTGLSPQLLHIIQCCNELVFCRDNRRELEASCLINRLAELNQVCRDVEMELELPGTALLVARKTSESYRLATILYIHYRILGYVRMYPVESLYQ